VLLLVTVGLVLAGLILLVIGFVQDSLTLIYLSIACAAIAGVALIVFSRLSRRQAVTAMTEGVPAAAAPPSPGLVTAGVAPLPRGRTSAGPPPPPPTAGFPGSGSEAPGPAVARRGNEPEEERFDPGEPTTQPVRAVAREAAPPTTRLDPVPVPAPVQAAFGAAEDDEWEDDWGDEVVFPIEDYDELRVAEIVPLLPELDPDELEEVRDREVAGRNRASIVARIDELLGRASRPAPPAKAPAPAKSQARRPAAARAVDAGAPAPAAAPSPAKKAPAAAGRAAAKKAAARAAPAPIPIPKKAGPAKEAGTSRKAAAKEAAAKEAAAAQAATARRAAPARSAAAKKASPAKQDVPSTQPVPSQKRGVSKKAASKSAAPADRAAPDRAQPADKAAPADRPARKRT
jgi:hypothetical protein